METSNTQEATDNATEQHTYHTKVLHSKDAALQQALQLARVQQTPEQYLAEGGGEALFHAGVTIQPHKQQFRQENSHCHV